MDATEVALLEQRRGLLEAQKQKIVTELDAIDAKFHDVRRDQRQRRRDELKAQIASLETQGKFDEAMPLKTELMSIAPKSWER